MANDEVWRSRYQEAVRFPYSWIGKAAELLHCARLVLDDSTTSTPRHMYTIGVYMMLSAYALENLLKGLILTRQPSVSQAWLFSGHDLEELASKAGLEVTESETRLLCRLETFAVQSGRYPVPKTWKAYKRQLDGSGEKRRSVFISTDVDLLESLIRRVKHEFESLDVNCDLTIHG